MKKTLFSVFAIVCLIALSTLSCKKEKEEILPFDVTGLPLFSSNSGLKYYILKQGIGPIPQRLNTVQIHFSIWSSENQLYYSTKEANSPNFVLAGVGFLIKGMEEALQTMNVGTSARLIIPASLAYDSVVYSKIPANSDIIVDLEILSTEVDQNIMDEVQKLDLYVMMNYPNTIKYESGLYYWEVSKGTGDTIKSGQKVNMDYKLSRTDETVIESTYLADPLLLQYGIDNLIRGFEQGLKYVQKGTKAVMIMPSYLAYGSQGNGNISGYTSLIFEIEVLNITD